jgi:hypothetical protein
MTISALVVTVAPATARLTLEQLARDPRLTLGDPSGPRVPVVAETDSCRDGRALVEHLQQMPGIEFVDVVLVDFSEEPQG